MEDISDPDFAQSADSLYPKRGDIRKGAKNNDATKITHIGSIRNPGKP
jgi:hypothetical protein